MLCHSGLLLCLVSPVVSRAVTARRIGAPQRRAGETRTRANGCAYLDEPLAKVSAHEKTRQALAGLAVAFILVGRERSADGLNFTCRQSNIKHVAANRHHLHHACFPSSLPVQALRAPALRQACTRAHHRAALAQHLSPVWHADEESWVARLARGSRLNSPRA
jgi:hypothetical protein